MPHTAFLRAMLSSGDCHIGLGVFDGLSARIAENAGAGFIHASGGAIARSLGYPDLGLITMTEMLYRIAEITDAATLPAVADADTGYGTEHNAARCARAYRNAGVAALHVEDQGFPKRCGLYAGVEVIAASEMAAKIRAMKDAVGDDIVIIARTDAMQSEGLNAALDRMQAYLDAGAEVAFVEGLDTADQIQAAAKALPGPKLINQAAASTGLPVALPDLGRMGYALAIYPAELQRAAIAAMDDVARAIVQTGDARAVADRLATGARRDGLVRTDRYL
jgi:2-methylisocitrate lyase-like PEP mutase family enzyme